MDVGSLERVIVALRSGPRRVHGSRNGRSALRQTALGGAALPQHAERVTVELAVDTVGRLVPTPRRVGDLATSADIKVTLGRVGPQEALRKLLPKVGSHSAGQHPDGDASGQDHGVRQ